MKRKLVLLAGTFLVVLVVIGLWLLVSPPAPTYETAVGRDVPPVVDPAPTAARLGNVPDSREGYQLWSEERDPETGRLETIRRVRKWTKQDDGLLVLSKPSVILFQRDGKQVTIRSDSGEAVVEEVAGRLRVKSGTLTGNVRVFLDRATDERRRRIPPEERPEVVRIYTDRIDFSIADQEIRTDSDVFLFSQEADICGRGLRLSWKDRPRELRELEIRNGDIMIVHNAAGQPQMLLPVQGDSPAEQSTDQRAVIEGPKPPAPATAPGKTRKEKAPKESLKEKPASNIFVADFLAGREDVQVDSGEGSLRGARKLSLIFHFDPLGRWGREPKAGLPQPPAQEDRPRSIDEPAPMPLEPADRSGRAAAPRPAPPGPQTRPQRAGQPLIVRWDGPLILRPWGYTETPSARKYSLAAEGERVVLSDPHTTAICRKFTYQNAGQVGVLSGAEGAPARLLLDDGQEIVCEAIEFDRRGNRAKLTGRGYMTRPARSAAVAGASAAGISATMRPAATQPAGDRIEWSESVVAIFGREPVRSGDSRQGGRQFIKEATFVGDVQLTQQRTGDFIKCQQLHVWMARDDAGRSYPLKAIATGDAYARQRGSDILADEITVTFKPTGDESTGDLDGGVKPATLLAVGNVKITDRRGDEPVTAVADRLDSNLLKRTAVLTGRLARLTQGDNVLAGRRIRLWERKYLFRKRGYPDVVAARQFARVDGAGELLFLTRRDLSGTALSEPRPIRITWKEGMEYHPKRLVGGIHPTHGVAVFRGDVNVDSVMDHMSCEEMEVEFERAAAVQGPPAGEGGKAPDTGVVRIAGYSGQKMTLLTAKEQVVLTSRHRNERGQLLRRLQVRGPRMVYNVQTGVVNMPGSGTMMSEDYRRGGEPAAQLATERSARVDRPSLTAFEWRDAMELDQKRRRVVMKGNVIMEHRSGRYVYAFPLVKKLDIPHWGGEVPPGRKTGLRCDEMVARFARPDVASGTRPSDGGGIGLDAGPKLGPLDLFQATGKVYLTDEYRSHQSREIIAERVIFDRTRDLVLIYGHLKNQPKPWANATLVDKDLRKMTQRTVSSPRIIWYRKNRYRKTDRIETGAISASGS